MYLKCREVFLTKLGVWIFVARQYMHPQRVSMFAATIAFDDKTKSLRMLFGFVECKRVYACRR
jgi:hypothetical protein